MRRPYFRHLGATLLVLLGAAPDTARDDLPLSAGPAMEGGWVESARGFVDGGSWVSEMRATFTVPSSPRDSGQLLFFFPGLQPAASDVIIQPILRYYQGGWSLLSERYERDNVQHSAIVDTAPGHEILGTMRSSSCSSKGVCTWTITTTDVTTGASTELTERDSKIYTWYFAGVVEAYGVRNCRQYPPDGFILFQDIVVLDEGRNELPVAPHQKIESGPPPDCGFGLSQAPLSSSPGRSVVKLLFNSGCVGGC